MNRPNPLFRNFFYDLCDELGLLVWQDFMFSCSLYPSTDEFLGEVKLEVDYQVRRLGHHACIALWCGDMTRSSRSPGSRNRGKIVTVIW